MNGIKYCAESRYFIDVWERIIQIFDVFCITSYNNFLVKSLLLSCFLKQLIDNQQILEVSTCSIADTALFRAKTSGGLLWELVSWKQGRYLHLTVWKLICSHQVLFKKTGISFSWPQPETVKSLQQLTSGRLLCTKMLHRQPEWYWNAGKLSFRLWILLYIPLGFCVWTFVTCYLMHVLSLFWGNSGKGQRTRQ